MGLFKKHPKSQQGLGKFDIPPATPRPEVDASQIPEGARKRMDALGEEGFVPDLETADETLPRTDALGRFNTANQNPFPIPAAFREGNPRPGDSHGKGRGTA